MSFFTPIFIPGLSQIISPLFRLEQEQKRFLKIHFEFAYFSFFLPHLELKQWIRLYILTSSLQNRTRFQTQMGKVYTHFQTKTAQKPYPLGWHIYIYMASIRECPALPGQKVSANENFKTYRVQQNNSPSLQSQGQFRQDQASKEMLLSKRSGQLRHAVAYYHSVAWHGRTNWWNWIRGGWGWGRVQRSWEGQIKGHVMFVAANNPEKFKSELWRRWINSGLIQHLKRKKKYQHL